MTQTASNPGTANGTAAAVAERPAEKSSRDRGPDGRFVTTLSEPDLHRQAFKVLMEKQSPKDSTAPTVEATNARAATGDPGSESPKDREKSTKNSLEAGESVKPGDAGSSGSSGGDQHHQTVAELLAAMPQDKQQKLALARTALIRNGRKPEKVDRDTLEDADDVIREGLKIVKMNRDWEKLKGKGKDKADGHAGGDADDDDSDSAAGPWAKSSRSAAKPGRSTEDDDDDQAPDDDDDDLSTLLSSLDDDEDTPRERSRKSSDREPSREAYYAQQLVWERVTRARQSLEAEFPQLADQDSFGLVCAAMGGLEPRLIAIVLKNADKAKDVMSRACWAVFGEAKAKEAKQLLKTKAENLHRGQPERGPANRPTGGTGGTTRSDQSLAFEAARKFPGQPDKALQWIASQKGS